MSNNILGFNYPGVGDTPNTPMYQMNQQVVRPVSISTGTGFSTGLTTASPSGFTSNIGTNGINYWSNGANGQTNRRPPTSPSAFGFNSISAQDWQDLSIKLNQIYTGPDAVDADFSLSEDGRTTTITLRKSEDEARQKAVTDGVYDERNKPQTYTTADANTINKLTQALRDQRHAVKVTHEQVDENRVDLIFTTQKSHAQFIEKALNADLGEDTTSDEEETTKEEPQSEIRRGSSRSKRRTNEDNADDSDSTHRSERSSETKKKSQHRNQRLEQHDQTEQNSDDDTSDSSTIDRTKQVYRPGLWQGSAFENWHDKMNSPKESNHHESSYSISNSSVKVKRLNDRLDATNANRERYEPIAIEMARKYGIDEYIFTRKIMQESGFNPKAVSPVGARGIAQFMPDTGAKYGLHTEADFFNPVKSLEASAKHHRDTLNRPDVDGDYAKALSVYNSGRPNAYKNPAFANGETYKYVNAILSGAA